MHANCYTCTHWDWAHRQQVSTTFLTWNKTQTNFSCAPNGARTSGLQTLSLALYTNWAITLLVGMLRITFFICQHRTEHCLEWNVELGIQAARTAPRSTCLACSIETNMSIITLQLGQCGNQVGGQLFNSVMDDLHASPASVNISPRQNSEYIQESKETFFSEQKNSSMPVARAVMVDMETKAITQTMMEAKKSGRFVCFWSKKKKNRSLNPD